MVHKAGQPFTVRVTPSPATATNYNGDPTVSGGAVACSLPATCSNGALTLGTFTNPIANNGMRESTTATYNEAGAFNVTLIDQAFASIDSDDTPATCAGYHICQSAAPLAVGRFVPDHFAFVVPGGTTPPQFRTFDQACAAPRSFTYIGAPFGYVTRPTARVEARNAAGSATTNYRGSLFKLTTASLAQNYSMTGQTINPSLQTPALTAIGNGTATFTSHANDLIAIARNAASASAPFNASIQLRWIAEDDAELALNGTITTSPGTGFVFDGGGSGIAFDAGSQFRYGRLRVQNANGSQTAALPVVMETQYFSGAGGFVTNAADNCTAISTSDVALTFSGNLAACETAITAAGAVAAGRRTLVLPAPGNGNDGAATLRVNLDNAAGTTCLVPGGATSAITNASKPWLQGNWTGAAFDDDPTARATFGTFKGSSEVIFIRENF